MYNNNVLLLGIGILSYLLFQNNHAQVENFLGGSSSPVDVAASDITVDQQTGNAYLQNGTTGGLFVVSANFCGFCKKLKAAVAEAGLKNVFYFEAGTKSQEVSTVLGKLQVSSFPTMYKIGANGLLMVYEGGRSPQELQQNFS